MATCRFVSGQNCEEAADVFAENDIIYGSNGNLFRCVNSAGCANDVEPTVLSADWEALVGDDPGADTTGDSLRISSNRVDIYSSGVLRVRLGEL